MTSRSKHFADDLTGISIFEMMVVLAIISLALAGTAQLTRGPSPTLKLDAYLSDLSLQAHLYRRKAMLNGKTRVLDLLQNNSRFTYCSSNDAFEILFFPDGTNSEIEFCVQMNGIELNLRTDPLTGQITKE